MRLGVVLTGAGACAAASAGALTWLLDAGVSPCAVCGMQAAAWPAALYLAGYDAGRLRGAAAQAARMGRRLLRADASASAVLGMKKSALCRGRRLEKLLAAQTGERALGLCERQGVFLCVVQIDQKRPRREVAPVALVQAKSGERGHLEMFQQRALRVFLLEIRIGQDGAADGFAKMRG